MTGIPKIQLSMQSREYYNQLTTPPCDIHMQLVREASEVVKAADVVSRGCMQQFPSASSASFSASLALAAHIGPPL